MFSCKEKKSEYCKCKGKGKIRYSVSSVKKDPDEARKKGLFLKSTTSGWSWSSRTIKLLLLFDYLSAKMFRSLQYERGHILKAPQ